MTASSGAPPGRTVAVRAVAPAKVNLALEVLGRRRDGYHDIDTVITTIGVLDEVRVTRSDALEVAYSGAHSSGIEADDDLVSRAARALGEACSREPRVRIEVRKRIPHPAGLGGGSSDAAATLRALNALWDLGWSAERLADVGSGVGSDVPFLVHGGTAHVTGRGEQVEPLKDLVDLRFLVLVPPTRPGAGKTANRYASLERADFTSGERSRRLAARIARGAPPPTRDLVNAFEASIERTDDELMAQLAMYRAAGGAATLHLCGSGPAVYLFVAERAKVAELKRDFEQVGAEVFEAHTLGRAAATRVELERGGPG